MGKLAVVMNGRNAGNHQGDIIGQNKLGENFLSYEIPANAVEVIHGDTILQEKEGRFDLPAQIV